MKIDGGRSSLTCEPRETAYFKRSAPRGWPLSLTQGIEAGWPRHQNAGSVHESPVGKADVTD
ncbi:MAG TPA: hypothetical protein DDY27_08895 [Hyphomonadaceae bacterium]|nr:hypothetical protein [Hyphomonadaceae bacterium]